MNYDTFTIFSVTAVAAIVTIALRAFPFLLFSSKKKCPAIISYIGNVLSPAAIAMLAVYCIFSAYRGKDFSAGGFGLPELAAGITVIALHWWKRNPLLPIICGTAVYLFAVQKFLI